MTCPFAAVKTAIPWATALIAIGYGIYITYRSSKSAGCSGRCNNSVELNNAKVVTTVDIEDIDKKAVYCRCWKSKKFPLCDGSHNKHNETTGDNVGPLIVQKNQ